MAKTPEQVIAKLQRRLENTGKHTVGLIDKLEGWRKMAKRMEDTLAYAWRQLEPLRLGDPAVANVLDAIEHVIPTRVRAERAKRTEQRLASDG